MPTSRGTLGDDAETLAACLKFDEEFDRAGERLGVYAHLKTAEDTADSRYQRMQGRFINVAGRASEAACYIRPEILAIPDRADEAIPRRRRVGPLSGCCWNDCCDTSRTRWGRRRKSCWRCRPKWPRPPARSFAN